MSNKSGYFYLILLVGIALSVIYFLKFHQPSAINNFHQQAFKLNYSAFMNGIRLANYQFLVKKNSEGSHHHLKARIHSELKFNQQGYPVGKNLVVNNQQTPQNKNHCIDIWNSVLGSLRPKLSASSEVPGYWVDLTKKGICIFQTTDLKGFKIQYDAKLGKVTILKISG